MFARGANFVSCLTIVGCALFAASCSDSTAPPKATGLIFVTPPSRFATMVPPNIQPVVQVVDAQGHAVNEASQTITASVTAGPGQVTAGATATTNANGVATFSNLTIGAVSGQAGQVTLQFSAEGLEPLTATVDLQCALLPISASQTVTRSLTTGDCTFADGNYFNAFSLATTQSVTAVQLSFAGTFAGGLYLQGPHETHTWWGYEEDPRSTDHRISYKMLVPAGNTYVAIKSVQPSSLGSYTLTTAPASEDLICEPQVPIAASPIASVQKLDDSDCAENSFRQDFLLVGLPPQATLSASMSSSEFDPTVQLLNAYTSEVVTSTTGQGTTNVTFKADTASYYYLEFTSAAPAASGAYNFTLTINYAPAAISANLNLPNMNQRLPLPRANPFRRSVLPGRPLQERRNGAGKSMHDKQKSP